MATSRPDAPLNSDAILPGLTEAYIKLRSQKSLGLQTSTGSFYNHTMFGRDASMAAKFVSDFDHTIVREVIVALARHQGSRYNSRTQEQPGRIHHELRDFRLWKGTFFERLPFWLLASKWDIRDHRLLSYFALDTTASYIRLVHKHAVNTDRSILTQSVENQHGDTATIEASVVAAAEWIMDKVDDRGLVGEWRRNPWSLPFQTFQDSIYARHDGTIADYGNFITYVEVQALCADALLDAVYLLPDHKKQQSWRDTALRMHHAMLDEFVDTDGFLASAIDSRGPVDVANVSAGWTLNTLLWDETSKQNQMKYISAIVERLFSDEFLTPVGLRTRTKTANDPIKKVVDYHGSETVWPMFSFMVVEGLRRHRLYNLADQLEHRIVNGLNAAGGFPEYHIVHRNGVFVLPTTERGHPTLSVQMKQEQGIAFSVVPAMVIAHRTLNHKESLQQIPWQVGLEKRILATIDHVERVEPHHAITSVGPTEYRRLRRWDAGIRTSYYMWKQRSNVSG